jgi:hypothetical protein
VKFDLQSFLTAITLLTAIVAFGYTLKADIAVVQVTQQDMKERSNQDREQIKKDIWRVEQKVNEITKTVVK